MTYQNGRFFGPAPDADHVRLKGTGRVADDLYLIAHHEVSGKPYLPPRSTGIALAGGLLAELLAAAPSVVRLDRGFLFPRDRKHSQEVSRYARPDDPVLRYVLDLIVAESRPRPVRDWLLFVSKTSAAHVAGRLEQAGYLTRPASRAPRRTRWPVPQSGELSCCALLRARAALDATRPLSPYLALLTGLTVASGLGFRLSEVLHEPARSDGEMAQVLTDPLRDLIAHVQMTADAVVLSTRT